MTTQQELFPHKKNYTLNEGQQGAFDWFLPFLLGEEVGYRKVLLDGHAGTGKTFLMNRVIEEVRRLSPEVNIGMTAPTHKAVKVLKKNSELKEDIEFGTIHSFLGLKESLVEHKDGTMKIEYKPDFNPSRRRKIDGLHVLVIDESSMLPDVIFGYLEDELRSNYHLRIVFMGDSFQIPPVGKKDETGECHAIPFLPSRQKSHNIYVLHLTEPQRQAKDSPIIMYSVAIREQAMRQMIDYPIPEEDNEHLQRLRPKNNLPKMHEIFKLYFKSEEFEKDPDYAKFIAYRNKTVDWANNEIRPLIYEQPSLAKIIEGEKLVMDEPIIEKDKIIIAKNMDVMAVDIMVDQASLRYSLLPATPYLKNKLLLETGEAIIKKVVELKVYTCDLIDEEGHRTSVKIIHEDSEKELEEIRESIKVCAMRTQDKFERKTMWGLYYKIKDNFAWVKYNYAITCHKSQGSTYINAISMEWDIEDGCKDIDERNRLRYVAATRAKSKLWVIK